VVNWLKAKGHEVVGFDLITPTYPIDSFTMGDFTSKSQFDRALRGINVVCHLGGVGDVYLSERDPALAFRANSFGTKVVCDGSVDARVEKLVYASTWEVYGKPYSKSIDETHPCNPESAYSVSKLAGELFVRGSDGRNGIKTVALRLGTAYGPFMRESGVILRFIRQSMAGTPLTVQGDGAQFRQFTHATDIGRAVVAVLSRSPPERIYNIAADEPITIIDLARLISKRSREKIEFQPERESEPASARISSARAVRDLRWRQTIRFQDGLDSLIAHSRNKE